MVVTSEFSCRVFTQERRAVQRDAANHRVLPSCCPSIPTATCGYTSSRSSRIRAISPIRFTRARISGARGTVRASTRAIAARPHRRRGTRTDRRALTRALPSRIRRALPTARGLASACGPPRKRGRPLPAIRSGGVLMITAKPHPLQVPFDGTFEVPARPRGRHRRAKNGRFKDRLEDEAKALGDAQHRLYADGRYAVLLIFQALDAAGKDSTIRHVFTGVNPCGLHVASFKQPYAHRARPRLPVALHRSTCPSAAASRSSIAATTRRCSSCACTPSSSRHSSLPEPPTPSLWADGCDSIAITSATRPSRAPWSSSSGSTCRRTRATQALPRSHRGAGQELEVQCRRPRRARPLGRLSRGVRGLLERDVAPVGAVVRGACRQQTLHALASGDDRATIRSSSSAWTSRAWAPRRELRWRRRKRDGSRKAESRASGVSTGPAARLAVGVIPRGRRDCRGTDARETRAHRRRAHRRWHRREHVQSSAGQILQAQIAIGVELGAFEPWRERIPLRDIRAQEIERGVESYRAQRASRLRRSPRAASVARCA